ncbi:MAG: hypothetical protein AAGF24_00470 [Cyanobacteria bacterium P01_H01_bin.121]
MESLVILGESIDPDSPATPALSGSDTNSATDTTVTVALQGFSGQFVQLPAKSLVWGPRKSQYPVLERPALLERCTDYFRQIIAHLEAQQQRPVERLLLLLPDKTRLQLAARLILDIASNLKLVNPNLQITLLYGLGTHPLMTDAELEALIEPERYQALQAAGVTIQQQTTRANLNPLRGLTVFHPEEEDTDTPRSQPAASAFESVEQLAAQFRAELTKVRTREGNLDGVVLETFWYHQQKLKRRTSEFIEHVSRYQLLANESSIEASNPDTSNPDASTPNSSTPDSASSFDRNRVPPSETKAMASPDAETTSTDPPPASDTNYQLKMQRGRYYSIKLPIALWEHDLTIVAGDLKLHPYEGRYGSGGINKMLAVGIASMNAIRRTHSTSLLMDPETRTGNPSSPFVKRIEAIADAIRHSLLTRPGSRAQCIPFGLSVAGDRRGIWGVSLGTQETVRQPLAEAIKEIYTVPTSKTINILVADVEPHKATDILAGARPIQYVCNWDTEDNPLLAATPQERVAVLFNPCNEPQNNQGIGNHGTKAQLDVLGIMIHETLPTLKQQLQHVRSIQAGQQLLVQIRLKVLHAWRHHLEIVSETEVFFRKLRKLTLEIRNFQILGLDSTTVESDLLAILTDYSGECSDATIEVARLQTLYAETGDLQQVIDALEQLEALYEEHEGLGEGGQRALRLLDICDKFATLILATDNQAVLQYLKWLNPDLTDYLPTPLMAEWQQLDLRFSILGLIGLDIGADNAQVAIETATRYATYYSESPIQPCIGFLKSPVILQHR